MKRKNLFITAAVTTALALTVWTIGATVNLSTIGFSVNSGDVVSASDFNSAFATVDSNFADVEAAINEHDTDQPGAAQDHEDFNAVSFDGSLQTAFSASIDVPSDGFVLAIVSGYAFVSHSAGTTSAVEFGVSDDESIVPPAQDIDIGVPSNANTGTYDIPFSTQRLFAVDAAGTETFHLLTQRVSGSGGGLADVTMSLMFVPNAYGTVTSSSVGASSAGERQ